MQVVGFAGAQLKKGLELANKLGAECFMFRATQEGYISVLNTDMQQELQNYFQLLKMTHGNALFSKQLISVVQRTLDYPGQWRGRRCTDN